jgi:hypothetical protein
MLSERWSRRERKREDRDQRTEDRGRRATVRWIADSRLEISDYRRRRSGVKGWRMEDRRRKTKQKLESGKQKRAMENAESRNRESRNSFHVSDFCFLLLRFHDGARSAREEVDQQLFL